MACIHAFSQKAPAASGIIHWGATSCYCTDGADLIAIRDGLDVLAKVGPCNPPAQAVRSRVRGPPLLSIYPWAASAANHRRLWCSTADSEMLTRIVGGEACVPLDPGDI